MPSPVSQHHPLRRLFGTLTEKSFTEKLGWPDLNVTEYVSNLLVEFTDVEKVYRIRTQHGRPIDTVLDLLFESEVLFEAQSIDRERDVHHSSKLVETGRFGAMMDVPLHNDGPVTFVIDSRRRE